MAYDPRQNSWFEFYIHHLNFYLNFIAEYKVLHSSFRFLIIGKLLLHSSFIFKLNSFIWPCSPYIFNSLHQITLAESYSNSTLKIFNTTSEVSFTLQWSLIKTICRRVGRGWLFSPSCFAPFVQTWRSVRTCCCTRNFGAFRFLSGRWL